MAKISRKSEICTTKDGQSKKTILFLGAFYAYFGLTISFQPLFSEKIPTFGFSLQVRPRPPAEMTSTNIENNVIDKVRKSCIYWYNPNFFAYLLSDYFQLQIRYIRERIRLKRSAWLVPSNSS
jgi:hypothetical protein